MCEDSCQLSLLVNASFVETARSCLDSEQENSARSNINPMNIVQKQINLKPRPRGFHLVTEEIIAALPEIKDISAGICHIFIQHSSAGLTINENADSSVRKDFETWINMAVPENMRGFRHNSEGSDDMPAHIKASLMGSSVFIPITEGQLALGIWQGVYLCEHRDEGGSRSVVVTAVGF
jgi:secondary thiamine-phosphate synthase enzyme